MASAVGELYESGVSVLEPPVEVAPRVGGGGRDGGPPSGGGGGGGGGERHDSGPPISAPIFGMLLALSSICMLFAGLVGSYIVLRFGSAQWPPPGFPALPSGLWVPTIVLLASSVTMALAVRSIRAGDVRGLRLRLSVTTLLGVLFVVAQIVIWRDLLYQGLTIRRNVYGANFYLLTGLHAFHVLSGLLALAFVWGKAVRGGYSRESHDGVRTCALYWHFLDGLWVFLFAVLYLL